MKAIPTKFDGVDYRSRLEARWAAFFTLAGWKFEYEPFDCDGWIPDFLLMGTPRDILVEVKPVTRFDEDVAAKISSAYPLDQGEVLLVGCTLPEDSDSWVGQVNIGWLRHEQADCTDDLGEEREDYFGWWALAPMGHWIDGKGRLGFCHEEGSFRDRISGGYDGGCFGGLYPRDERRPLVLWREAGNRTQWRKP